jgi:hypothetical protein
MHPGLPGSAPLLTPLVFSVDGLQGIESKAAGKRLTSLLSAKWKRTYSAVVVGYYVNSRLSVALARATSLCLRGAREPTYWETGEGLAAPLSLSPALVLSLPPLLPLLLLGP